MRLRKTRVSGCLATGLLHRLPWYLQLQRRLARCICSSHPAMKDPPPDPPVFSSHQPSKSQTLTFPSAQGHVSFRQQGEKRSRVDTRKPASWSPRPFRPIPVSGRHRAGSRCPPITCPLHQVWALSSKVWDQIPEALGEFELHMQCSWILRAFSWARETSRCGCISRQ